MVPNGLHILAMDSMVIVLEDENGLRGAKLADWSVQLKTIVDDVFMDDSV